MQWTNTLTRHSSAITASFFILGTVYVHPYITYPLFSHQRSFLPHIRTFETSDGFAQIYEAIVTQDGGRKTVIRKNDDEKTKEYEYFWKRLELNHLCSFLHFSDSNLKPKSCCHPQVELRERKTKTR